MKLMGMTAACALLATPVFAADTTTSACIDNTVREGETCKVFGYASLGEGGEATWSWALYEIKAGRAAPKPRLLLLRSSHAAPDVIEVAQVIDPPLSLQRWGWAPYQVLQIIRRGDVTLLGATYKGESDALALAAWRLDGPAWTALDFTWPQVESEAAMTAAVPDGCEASGDTVDWPALKVSRSLFSEKGACGTAEARLSLDEGHMKIAEIVHVR